MNLNENITVITGAASGIGEALAERLLQETPAALVLADVNVEALNDVADRLGYRTHAVPCDVSNPAEIAALIESTQQRHGHIDLFCSNAGIATGKGLDADQDLWTTIFEINVMASVHAARSLLAGASPQRRTRLLITASAAGLLTNLGDLPYTATKHAAVGVAEWLQITHSDAGLDVSCLCPQGVNTPMVTGGLSEGELGAEVVKFMGLIEPSDVAEATIAGLRADEFLILPHPEVAKFRLNKATDTQRWLASMRKLNRSLSEGNLGS